MLLLNYIFKGFSVQDFKFIFKIINIKNIYNSVALELKKEEEIWKYGSKVLFNNVL